MRVNDQIRALKSARRQRLDELVRELEPGGTPSSQPLEKIRSQLDLFDFAIRELSSGWRSRTASLAAAGALVGLVISILSVSPMRSVPFTLDLKATTVSVVSGTEVRRGHWFEATSTSSRSGLDRVAPHSQGSRPAPIQNDGRAD